MFDKEELGEYQTIKDYALSRGVSYETVRRQVNRYKDELKGHAIYLNRQTYLDLFAFEFLDEHRGERRQLLSNLDAQTQASIRNQDEEIKRLQALVIELQQFKIESARMQARAELIEEREEQRKQEIADARAEAENIREELDEIRAELEREKERARAEIADARAETEKARAEADEAREEAGRFQKSIFGLWKKV